MFLDIEWPSSTFNIRSGIDKVSRRTIKYWGDTITEVGLPEKTMEAICRLNDQLRTGNAIIFFDHHYAFDAVPACLVLEEHLTNLQAAIVPYAVHLELGVDPEGNPSTYYYWRSKSFNWFTESFESIEPDVHMLPVERDFERNNPRIKSLVDSEFPGANLKYIKQFKGLFNKHKSGLVCVQAPMAGLALPGKPLLNEQIYKLIESVQKRQDVDLPCYFVSAYPKMLSEYHYMAPLLTKHTFMADGPFMLPSGNYNAAQLRIEEMMYDLRGQLTYELPDHEKVQHK